MRVKISFPFLLFFGGLFLISHSIFCPDTFALLTREKKQIKVRLSEIDTTEKAQPFGTRASQALSVLIFSKEVKVIQDDIDSYGRIVGQVFVCYLMLIGKWFNRALLGLIGSNILLHSLC